MKKVLLGAAFVLMATVTLRADDWPQWLGPKRDGVWREEGIVEKFPKDGPKVVWEQPTGTGYASPAVADGRLFISDFVPGQGVALPMGGFAKGKFDGKEQLTARDALTGKLLWTADNPVTYTISYPAGPRCTPAVDAEHVYTLGAMGDLRCYQVATGKLTWSKNFPKDYSSRIPVWGYAAHPLIDGDQLICLVGGSEERLVVAFDKRTGKELWTSESCQGDFGYCPPMIYEFDGKRQLIIWHRLGIVGLEPASGKQLWRVPFTADNALTAPTPRKVGEDGLFITSFYNGSMLLKVGAAKADVVWKSTGRGERPGQIKDLNAIIASPVVSGDYIYGVCGYGQLRCIEAKTGTPVWETMKAVRGKRTPEKIASEETPAESERWANAFLIPQGDRYFLFNEQGDLIIAKLSGKGYEELDRAHLIDPTNPMAGSGRLVVWMHPTFAGKCVYVRNDKKLICYSLAR